MTDRSYNISKNIPVMLLAIGILIYKYRSVRVKLI